MNVSLFNTTYSVALTPQGVYHLLCCFHSTRCLPLTLLLSLHKVFTTYSVAFTPQGVYHLLCCFNSTRCLPLTLLLSLHKVFTTYSVAFTPQGVSCFVAYNFSILASGIGVHVLSFRPHGCK